MQPIQLNNDNNMKNNNNLTNLKSTISAFKREKIINNKIINKINTFAGTYISKYTKKYK